MGNGTTVVRHRPIDVSFRSYSDVRTRVLEVAGSGAPLICLHGYSDLADTWRPLMRSLCSSGRQVIAVDLPSFGHASRLKPGPVLPQLDEFVADLVWAEAGKAGQSAFVIGNSLGGIAALRAGANSTLPVAGVVPISPAGFGHSRAIKWAEQHGDDLLPRLQRPLVPMPVVRGVMGVMFRRASCAHPRSADREAVRAYVQQFRTREDMERIFGPATALLAEIRTEADPPVLDVPLMLLWGDRDRLTLHRGAARIQAANPHTELVTLTGQGHCPQLEIAPRVARLVADFVDRHSILSVVKGSEAE